MQISGPANTSTRRLEILKLIGRTESNSLKLLKRMDEMDLAGLFTIIELTTTYILVVVVQFGNQFR